MPYREELPNTKLQQTLQELLATHDNEAVLQALASLTGVVNAQPIPSSQDWSIEEAITAFKKSDVYADYAKTSKRTYEVELEALTRYLVGQEVDCAKLPISDLVLSDKITLLTEFISKAKAESTKNKRKSVLRKLLRFGLQLSGMSTAEIERNLNRKVFAIGKVSNHTIKYLDLNQIKEVLSLSLITTSGLRNYVMLSVFLSTGLRNSELTNLTVQQVHENDQMLEVYRKRKKGQLSQAFISEEGMRILIPYIRLQFSYLGNSLDEIKKNLGDEDNYVFFSHDCQKPLTERTVQNVVKNIVRKSKSIPDERKDKITPHSLRHSFAVNCLKNGVNIYSLMKLMDHSSLGMLGQYLKLTNQDYQDDLNKGSVLDNLVGGEFDIG